MSVTQSTNTSTSLRDETENPPSRSESPLSELAYNIKYADRDVDKRECRRDDCDGRLMVEDDRVVCSVCRTTPDGIYVPPKSHDKDREVYYDIDSNGQTDYRTWSYPSSYSYPYPSEGENHHLQRYDNSNRVRLPGGCEAVYDENDDRRPNGVTEEYTFDLTTLKSN